MQRRASTFLLALFVAAGALAADKNDLVVVSRQFAVDVDATGLVTSVRPEPDLPAAVNAAIADGIRKARFSAPMRDGRAVTGTTYLWASACAAPEAGAYRFAVRVGKAGPASALPQPVVPAYPPDAMRAGVSASYDVEYQVLPDGSAQLLALRRTSGGGARGAGGFEAVLRQWVAALRFHPESLEGKPVATRLVEPVEFRMTPGRRRVPADSENPTCELALRTREATDAKSQAVALDTPFRVLHAN